MTFKTKTDLIFLILILIGIVALFTYLNLNTYSTIYLYPTISYFIILFFIIKFKFLKNYKDSYIIKNKFELFIFKSIFMIVGLGSCFSSSGVLVIKFYDNRYLSFTEILISLFYFLLFYLLFWYPKSYNEELRKFNNNS